MTKKLDSMYIEQVLKELDSYINEPLNIVLCGGAAGILEYGLMRTTGDIDLIKSKPKILKFNKYIKKVAEKYSLDDKWINDAPKSYSYFLSKNYINRLVKHSGDFKYLSVYVLSLPDYITLKLSAGREVDILDVKNINITKDEIEIIKENIEHISSTRHDVAYKIESYLFELGFIKKKETNREDITNLAGIIQYSYSKGLNLQVDVIYQIKSSIENGKSISDILDIIDKKIIEIENKNNKGMDI